MPSHEAHVSIHILVYEPPTSPDTERTARALDCCGHRVTDCRELRAVLEHLVRADADVLVFAPGDAQDLNGLSLVRRLAPRLPLVLLVRDDSLEARRALQVHTPMYYAVRPADPIELCQAVQAGVLSRTVRRAAP